MPSLCWTWNVLDMDPTFIYEGSKDLGDTAGTVFYFIEQSHYAINILIISKLSTFIYRLDIN